MKNTILERKPKWLKANIIKGNDYQFINKLVKENNLHTVCSSAKCPNAGECWGAGTATFMILGDICTRACKFCNVKTGKPTDLDLNEPIKVARSIKTMQLKHAVITSVDRDDLNDGGAEIWARTIREIKRVNPKITLETLIPDFRGDTNALNKVQNEKPEVMSHNIETVRRLTPKVRSASKYDRSLEVLKTISESNITTKSGIMLGLGELEEELYATMDDLLKVGCQVMTIGQYLQPSGKHLPVKEYISPELFKKYKKVGLEKGFIIIESGPFVRSSYHAERHVINNN